MAESGGEPLYEIHVIGDWSQFDQEARQREQQLAGRDWTFATEGRAGQAQIGGFRPATPSLPPPAIYSIPSPAVGMFGGGSFSTPSIQQAAEQMAQAFVRLIPNLVQRMQQATFGTSALSLRYPSIAVDPSIIDAEWAPFTDLATRRGLARRSGYVRPAVPWEEAVWEPAQPSTRPPNWMPTPQSRRGLPPPGQAGSYEAEVIDADWAPVTDLARGGSGGGMVPPPGLGGPGATPPGRGPRMWVAAGGGGGAGVGWGPGWVGGGGGGWNIGPAAAAGGWGPGWVAGGGARPSFWGRLGQMARSGISTGLYYNVMFGLWDVHRTTEALRHMETQLPGAQTMQDLLNVRAEGIRGATSGILSGIAGMGLDLFGIGPRQALNALETESISIGTQLRTRDIILGNAFASEIRGATPFGVRAVEAIRSRQSRIQAEKEGQDRLDVIGRLLGETKPIPYAHETKRFVEALGGSFTGYTDQYIIVGTQRADLERESEAIRARIEGARAQETFENRERQKDVALERIRIHSEAITTRARLFDTPQMAQRIAVRERQAIEMAQVLRFTPELYFDTHFRHRSEEQLVDYELAVQSRVRDEQSTSSVYESRLRGGRMFYTAARERIIGQMRAGIAANLRNPIEVGRIRSEGEEALMELYNTELFRRRTDFVQVTGGTKALQLQMDHKPLQEALQRLITEATVTLAAVPADNPVLYEALQEQFRKRHQAINQIYRENLYMRDFAGETEERYTEQLSGAFGPGARQKRLQAEVFRITREAELKAIGRQLEDVTDVVGRDRERQIGINRLGAFRAQYLEGFRAQEGSLFRTNLTNTASGSPEEILRAIDNGIKELTRRIGTLVAVK